MRINQGGKDIGHCGWSSVVLGVGLWLITPIAVTGQTIKIGFVHFDEVLAQLPEYRRLMQQIDSIRTKAYLDIKQIEQEVAPTQLPITPSFPGEMMQSLPNSAAPAQLRQRVAGSPAEKQLEAFRRDAENRLVKTYRQRIKPIHDRIQNAIRLIALLDGYTYVLNYSSETYQAIRYLVLDQDLTDSVLIQLGLQPGQLRLKP